MVSQLAEAEKGDVFEVTFLPAGKTISIGEDQTLLSAGLAAGFALPFSCTAGGCAVCRIKLVSGKVEMDQPNCLTDEEIAEGFCLLCVGHPRSALVLDLGDEEC
jgi:ferredoxin